MDTSKLPPPQSDAESLIEDDSDFDEFPDGPSVGQATSFLGFLGIIGCAIQLALITNEVPSYKPEKLLMFGITIVCLLIFCWTAICAGPAMNDYESKSGKD